MSEHSGFRRGKSTRTVHFLQARQPVSPLPTPGTFRTLRNVKSRQRGCAADPGVPRRKGGFRPAGLTFRASAANFCDRCMKAGSAAIRELVATAAHSSTERSPAAQRATLMQGMRVSRRLLPGERRLRKEIPAPRCPPWLRPALSEYSGRRVQHRFWCRLGPPEAVEPHSLGPSHRSFANRRAAL